MTMLIMTLLILGSCSSKAATEAASIVTDTAADAVASNGDSSEPTDDTGVADVMSTEPKVYTVDDLVTYYNDAASEEERTVYDEEHLYWIYTSTEQTEEHTKEKLQRSIRHYLDFTPLYRVREDGYMFRYEERYDENENSYTYVAVSSNRFAAITIESGWNSGELTTTVLIYDGRSGLYA